MFVVKAPEKRRPHDYLQCIVFPCLSSQHARVRTRPLPSLPSLRSPIPPCSRCRMRRHRGRHSVRHWRGGCIRVSLYLCDETRTHDATSFPVEGSTVEASWARYPSSAGYTASLRGSAAVVWQRKRPTLHHRITHEDAVTRILRKHARLTHVHLGKGSAQSTSITCHAPEVHGTAQTHPDPSRAQVPQAGTPTHPAAHLLPPLPPDHQAGSEQERTVHPRASFPFVQATLLHSHAAALQAESGAGPVPWEAASFRRGRGWGGRRSCGGCTSRRAAWAGCAGRVGPFCPSTAIPLLQGC